MYFIAIGYCHYANIILKHIWKANTILLSYISDYLTELSQMPFLHFSNEWGEVMRIPAERMALLLALFTVSTNTPQGDW